MTTCTDCNGKGYTEETCPECSGSGLEEVICPICNGSGEGNWDGSICSYCHGHGQLTDLCNMCENGVITPECKICQGFGTLD